METINMNAGDGGSEGRRPVALTRKRRNGEVLKRTDAVDSEICAMLDRSPDEVRRRARINGQTEADFVSAECLVYLLREAHRRDDAATVSVLWSALVARVWRHVESKLRTLGGHYAEDGAAKVTTDLGTLTLRLDSDKGDFLQVSFWTTIDRRAIDEFHRQRRLAKKDSKLTSLDALPGEEGHSISDGNDDDDHAAGADWASDSETPLDELERAELEREEQANLAIAMAEGGAALATLPDPIRQAFILRVKEGWQIESTNPNEPTIASALGKTPRTIRNYLKEAVSRLSKWREEAQ
jgi:DNA-directed RNA polymerase specialized sigma24 family protein